jgi:hypothetical protein
MSLLNSLLPSTRHTVNRCLGRSSSIFCFWNSSTAASAVKSDRKIGLHVSIFDDAEDSGLFSPSPITIKGIPKVLYTECLKVEG